MRRLIPLSTLLACGPITPQSGTTSTTAETTSTATSQSTTSDTAPTPTTAPGDPGTTGPLDFISHFDLPRTCDVWAQDCPPSQKCVPVASDGGSAWNDLKCVDIAGHGAPGDLCTAPAGPLAGLDDCALGSLCWDVDPDNHGTCIGQCTGTPDAPVCPAFHHCNIGNGGVLTLCEPWCDPLAQDCPANNFCVPFADAFLCAPKPNVLAGLNDPCESPNACESGLACIPPATASSACDPDAAGCCQPFCQLPDAPCPNPDQQCLPWYTPQQSIPPNHQNLGICKRPP